jgi:hypothetical protein
MPLLDDRRQLVPSEVHSVEVGQAIASLNVLANQTELAEISLVVVQISQRDFKNTSLEKIGGNF